MTDVHNPHDKIFKQIEKDPEIARDLLQGLCPQFLLDCIDLSTLTLNNNSYIAESLQEYYSDLVFTCNSYRGGTTKIALLLEHKRYKPDNEYIQLLWYMLCIWEYQMQNNESLTPIVPLILYHGTEPWEVTSFKDTIHGLDTPLQQYFPGILLIYRSGTDAARKSRNDVLPMAKLITTNQHGSWFVVEV